VRSEPRVDPLTDPKQPLAERRELRTAALLLGDERLAHTLGPRRDEAPSLTVGHAHLFGRLGQLAGILDRFQKRKKFRVHRLFRQMPGLPDQVQIQGGPRVCHICGFQHIEKGALANVFTYTSATGNICLISHISTVAGRGRMP